MITMQITTIFEGINLVSEVLASIPKVSQSSNTLFDVLILSCRTVVKFLHIYHVDSQRFWVLCIKYLVESRSTYWVDPIRSDRSMDWYRMRHQPHQPCAIRSLACPIHHSWFYTFGPANGTCLLLTRHVWRLYSTFSSQFRGISVFQNVQIQIYLPLVSSARNDSYVFWCFIWSYIVFVSTVQRPTAFSHTFA